MWNTSVACTYTSEIIMFSHSTDCFSSSWLGLSANTGWRIITVVLTAEISFRFLRGVTSLSAFKLYSSCTSVCTTAWLLFSLHGMHAPRAICSACVNFFLYFSNNTVSENITFHQSRWGVINLSDKLSQDLQDQLSPNFHRMVGIQSKITYLTLFFR